MRRETRADARRGARRHARRAGHGIAAIEQRVAAAVFVAVRVPLRQLCTPQAGRVLPGVDGQRVEHSLRDADIRNHDVAAHIAPGQQ